jgi:hypothetical protein
MKLVVELVVATVLVIEVNILFRGVLSRTMPGAIQCRMERTSVQEHPMVSGSLKTLPTRVLRETTMIKNLENEGGNWYGLLTWRKSASKVLSVTVAGTT